MAMSPESMAGWVRYLEQNPEAAAKWKRALELLAEVEASTRQKAASSPCGQSFQGC